MKKKQFSFPPKIHDGGFKLLQEILLNSIWIIHHTTDSEFICKHEKETVFWSTSNHQFANVNLLRDTVSFSTGATTYGLG